MTLAVPVRILLLLVLTASLADADPQTLLVATLLTAVAGGYYWRGAPSGAGRALFAMLRRVRWLLLAIVILYGWFMPGEPAWPQIGAFAPSVEGLWQGALRASALCVIVSAVYLLLSTTPRGPLVAGLLWFTLPLRRLGMDGTRFAVRLVLALEAVGQVQDLMRATAARTKGGSGLQSIASAAASVMQATLAQAENAPSEIDIPQPSAVPAWQWLIPGALAASLWLVL